MTGDPRIAALPDIHGHAKGEHKPFAEERPIPYTARMLFLWFFHACRRSSPRFLMVADHINYLTFEDPAAVNLVRRALKLAQAGDLYGAAETAGVELHHAAAVSDGLRRGMRYSIGAEVDNDPRSRPDAQNIVDAMRPDGMVRSVHFLPITHPAHGEWMWPFDNPEFKEFYDVVGTERTWELYMTTLLEAIDKLPGNIVGHFYVPAKFGHWPADDVLETYEDRLLDACAERGMAVEINSRYFYKYFADDDEQREKYRAVNLRLLRKAKARGVMVAVGSDAHSPRDQGNAFDIVLQMLDEAEINEIAFPINGRLARVALRATEETLRNATPTAEPIPLTATSAKSSAEEAALGPTVTDETSGADVAASMAVASTNGAAMSQPVAARRKRPSRAKTKPPEVEASDTVEAVHELEAGAAPGASSALEPASLPVLDVAIAEGAGPGTVTEKATVSVSAPSSQHDGASPPKRAARPRRSTATRQTTPAPEPARRKPSTKSPTVIKSARTAAKSTAKKPAKPARSASRTTAAAKKAGAKRSVARPAAKKTAAKKAPARKAPAKRTTPVRRPAAKKTVAKKSSKKPSAKKTVAKRKSKSRR